MIEEMDNEFEAQYADTDLNEEFDAESESTELESAGDLDHTDLLKVYLREASRAPMLNAAGEIAGAKRIERARRRVTQLIPRPPLVLGNSLPFREGPPPRG